MIGLASLGSKPKGKTISLFMILALTPERCRSIQQSRVLANAEAPSSTFESRPCPLACHATERGRTSLKPRRAQERECKSGTETKDPLSTQDIASAESPMLDAKKCWKKGAQFVAVKDVDTHLSTIRDHLMRRLSMCEVDQDEAAGRIGKRPAGASD
jgi:hypothetical protein